MSKFIGEDVTGNPLIRPYFLNELTTNGLGFQKRFSNPKALNVKALFVVR
jgi:hypothetical protein